LQSAYNAEAAKKMIEPGSNVVAGSALFRQNGGGIVTCAGLPIHLIPKTAYATERVQAIYGRTDAGVLPVTQPLPVFTNNEPDYLVFAKKTTCNAQGFFSFNNVADGEFFVIAQINWNAGYKPQGGSLMRAVRVSGGESIDVVLSQ
jgi:hypothetical protein